MLLRTIVCVGMAVARLAELAYSRRNLAEVGETTVGRWSAITYPIMILVHAVDILRTLFNGSDRLSKTPFILLLAVHPLRLWMFVTLRDRWNAHGAVPNEMSVETGGLYAFVRHPNYAIITVELAMLPLAFRLPRLALFATLVNSLLLAIRIREEEEALFKLPGYGQHFAKKKRLIPGIF
jgi:methyltransferase